MTFVSYAQNYEDVMLRRALRGVDKGFYIDVGAQDPKEHSVTKAFYDMGWRGINIEPSRVWFERLEEQRPHDINLQVAASDSDGQLRFHNILETGLSTINSDYAARHLEAGFKVAEQEVQSRTLDGICERNNVEVVHFLKVDCEGAEESALRGISLSRVRPWIILVEATEPLSEKPAYASWEPLLTDRGYHFVYDDGLNRFYVADEVAYLDKAFRHPPNVFDDFLRVAEFELRTEHASQQAQIHWQKMAEYLRSENDRREAALDELRISIDLANSKWAAERAALSEQVEFLNGENERRESALIALREVQTQAAVLSAQLDELGDEVGRLHFELEERNVELELLRKHQAEENERILQEIALVHSMELQTSNERQLEAGAKHLKQIESFNTEVGRLHQEVASRDSEILRLVEQLQGLLASTSWRITWPLRGVRRIFNFGARKVFVGGQEIKATLRPLLRAILLKAASWGWLRRAMVAAAGRDSRLMGWARRFLFAGPIAPALIPAVLLGDPVCALDWQSMRMHQHIMLRVQGKREDNSAAIGEGSCT